MSLSAKERAILDATAADLTETTPELATYLAEGPELLRIRGVKPSALDQLVPDWPRPPWRRRLRRRLCALVRFRWLRPPGPPF